MLRNIIVIITVSLVSVLSVYALDNYRDNRLGTDVCPAGMVFIPDSQGGFCMDSFEASPAEDCPVAKVAGPADTLANMDERDCQAVSSEKADPWVFVSQVQAAQLCARSGKRLPSPREWQSAALALASDDDCHLDRNWPERPGKTGFRVECRTAGGVYDMAGNVWEWTDGQANEGIIDGRDLPDSGYIAEMSLDGLAIDTGPAGSAEYGGDYWWIKAVGSRAVAKGGYYESGDEGGIFATYVVLSPRESSVGVGFRCVK